MNNLYPHITGINGETYNCQFRHKILNDDKTVHYTFLNESNGDTYTITKKADEWIFVSGHSHIDSWIEELGSYVDKSGI